MTEESPSTADRALLMAVRSWGDPARDQSFRRFAPAWRASLQAQWQSTIKSTALEALESLRRDHAGSARPDLSRIHPSWLVRALGPESPAVRKAVVDHSPSTLRERFLQGLGPQESNQDPGLEPDPEAVAWALALWTERLIGDVDDRAEDPPVIVAITRMRPREVARLVKVCGQVKHAFAIEGHGPSQEDEALIGMSDHDRVRIAFFRRLIGAADPRLVPAARVDLWSMEGDRRRGHSRLGLLTMGRLLDAAEPHRARWASQHLPYPVVKRMKERAKSALPKRALVSWESWILEAAWARLLSEGRLAGHREDQS